jgi:hypothetical protein
MNRIYAKNSFLLSAYLSDYNDIYVYIVGTKNDTNPEIAFEPSTKEQVCEVISFFGLNLSLPEINALRQIGFKKSSCYWLSRKQYISALGENKGVYVCKKIKGDILRIIQLEKLQNKNIYKNIKIVSENF